VHGGYAHGGATPVEASVSAGLGVTVRSHDVLGMGWSWDRPYDAALRDQYSLELFYRLQVTQRFAMTPDVQIIFDPSLNPNHDVIGVFGIRGRWEL
jgi:porin